MLKRCYLKTIKTTNENNTQSLPLWNVLCYFNIRWMFWNHQYFIVCCIRSKNFHLNFIHCFWTLTGIDTSESNVIRKETERDRASNVIIKLNFWMNKWLLWKSWFSRIVFPSMNFSYYLHDTKSFFYKTTIKNTFPK